MECTFCGLASGELKSFKVYESTEVFACLDINPAVPGHVILFPKKHYTFLSQLSSNELLELFEAATKISFSLLSLGYEGVNLIHSIGEAAGQRSTHLLLHIIPRRKGDKVTLAWEPSKVDEESLMKIQQQLVTKLQSKKEPREIKERPPSYW
ncbi:MAG: HIT family protein [Candidatus Nanoarchaeia archaeon]|nr:HIT family protein [Candidatus Haiyanarchaeum thermophilum]MCW1303420.1 HIT family protein [Candidatus Haiyanarchaeum thermophilum]MCW1303893.1 HIT family protein [Candidatus Haiyanarchaeum thermophilum]MCW1306878.1 HIT family protein [Candidatus Haiyanarchaeum thermophilum]MCW1307446.1 HIT family protein [Candidatus Haiyanarchaeum thermophilum]